MTFSYVAKQRKLVPPNTCQDGDLDFDHGRLKYEQTDRKVGFIVVAGCGRQVVTYCSQFLWNPDGGRVENGCVQQVVTDIRWFLGEVRLYLK